MDMPFFGGVIVLIAVLYLVFWLFDKFRKEKPVQETRGSIDMLCSFRCGLIGGALMVGLGILSLAVGDGGLALQGIALLIAGIILLVLAAFGRCVPRKPASPGE